MSRSRRASSEVPVLADRLKDEPRSCSSATRLHKNKMTVVKDKSKFRSKFGVVIHLMLWPFKLALSIVSGIYLSLCRMFESKIASADEISDDELIKFIPSILTFILGLIIIKYFEEPIESMVSSLLTSSIRAASNLEEVYDFITWDDFENFVGLGLVALFWIGCFRIISNLIKKIFRAFKTPNKT